MYDDGTEVVVYDKANGIANIDLDKLICTEKDMTDVTDEKFVVDRKTSDAGTVQSFTAQYTENGRTYNTMFDVTVGMPQTDIVKKVIFKTDADNVLYFDKGGKTGTGE